MQKHLLLTIAIALCGISAQAGISTSNSATEPVSGRIAYISEKKITVKIAGGDKIGFVVTSETIARLNGNVITTKELKPGWKVQVTPSPTTPANAGIIECNKSAGGAENPSEDSQNPTP